MNKVKPMFGIRSQTKQQLPNIHNKSARNTVMLPNKSYLGHISKQMSGNVEYDQMDNKNLTKEQKRLKQILMKMNDDTVQMISNFTPRNKKIRVHHRTASAILAVNEQQVENNNKIMSRCKFEVSKLQLRAEGLNEHTKQFYDAEIIKASQQILVLQEEIKNLRLENQKRGKSIMNQQRIIQQGQIKKAQTDVYLIELKAKHLRIEDQRVNTQIGQYDRKLKEIGQKWGQADKYLKQIEKQAAQKKNLKNNQVQLIMKKGRLNQAKRKNDFYIQNSQYKCYHLLRQVDDSNRILKDTDQKIDKCSVSIQASKMIIQKFESQLKIIRQKKKQRQNNVNQFLSKNKQQESNNNLKQTQIINNLANSGEMPSQIEIKQDQIGDNSRIQLQQAMKQQEKSERKNTQRSRKSKSRIKPFEDNNIQQKIQLRSQTKLNQQI